MKQTNVSDEMRLALMEAAAWDQVGVTPEFLVEEDDGEEVADAPAEEAPAEEAPAEESDDGDEEVVEEDISDSELLRALLSEMSDTDLLTHVEKILNVVNQASDVIEEEDDEAEYSA